MLTLDTRVLVTVLVLGLLIDGLAIYGGVCLWRLVRAPAPCAQAIVP
ncbi:hypothetical protein RGUI_0818 [Rhodovulum sp. P5]|nr:hypothetical protein [Rhodovulum sp. P5]YP_009285903.1 hypothetical protein BI026_gp18 [Rhodovulum phage vB_RhkS_P1]ANT39888.1 hypothetical protein Rhks_18 [Rhodovulum phage vB_RhkS_P1]ARE38959.1 hypothetical protein RGUI_0818 [Rhodovulum sp. P5]